MRWIAMLSVVAGLTCCGNDRDIADVPLDGGDSAVLLDLAEQDTTVGELTVSTDTSADESSGEDGGEDGGDAAWCAGGVLPQGIIELDPEGLETQIHVDAAADGHGVWLVYNLPDANKKFDVWATRLGCDGAVLVSPFKVNISDFNETEPEVAVAGGRVVVAWQSDNGSGVDNLDIWYRTFSVEGEAETAGDVELSALHGDSTLTANAWMAQVAVAEDGAFLIGGAFALPEAPVFQVGVQRFDGAGTATGALQVVHPDSDESQVFPSMGLAPDGTLYAAWTRSGVAGQDQAQLARLAPGADSFMCVDAGANSAPTSGAVFGVNQYGAFAAFTHVDGGAVCLVPGTRFDGSDAHLCVTGGPQLGANHSPVVAPGPQGGAIVWFANQSGLKNKLLFQRFSWDGVYLESVGSPEQLNEAGAPPYQPTLVHLAGDVYFAAWSEGSSPDFMVRGKFLF